MYSFIKTKLDKNLPSSVFLSNFRVMDESHRQSSLYTDVKYYPFFYWLGKAIQPKSLIEIGFNLGFCSGLFLKACQTIDNLLLFQQKTNQFYSPRLGKSNIKDYYKGKFHIHVGDISDEAFSNKLLFQKWNVAFINENTNYDQLRMYLDVIWLNLSQDGLIIADDSQAFRDFCKIKNRTSTIIDKRGIVSK